MRKLVFIPLIAALSAHAQAATDCSLTFTTPVTKTVLDTYGNPLLDAQGKPITVTENVLKTIQTVNPNGALLASQCYQCHGYQGRSLGEIDSIAGKSASDLYGDLIDFKNNGKKDIMSLQAREYSDCELEAIANYLSSLPN